MILAAAVLPHPPLLIPEVAAGAAAELDAVRAACGHAIAAGLAAGPDRVVIVGTGGASQPWPVETTDSLAELGLSGSSGELPLALMIGRWLLRRADWSGAVRLQSVAAESSAAECAAIGADLAAGPATLLLAMGDGSARRSLAAPGYLDERAEPFDAAVGAALSAADSAALLALDPGLAADLLAVGRPAWQVLAGAARASGGTWTGTLHAHEAPYGVGYLVASWLRSA